MRGTEKWKHQHKLERMKKKTACIFEIRRTEKQYEFLKKDRIFLKQPFLITCVIKRKGQSCYINAALQEYF